MKKRIVGMIFIVTMLITTMILPVKSVEAASINSIKTKDFIKSLVISMKLDTVSGVSVPYIDAALKAGILTSTDFNNNYSGYITRTDAAVLLNRADEYLHGNTLDEKLLNWVLTKRISDINKVSKEKREAVAKCVAKGIIKGYSNGYYIQNRAFRGSEYLTKSAAKAYIKLVVNPAGRAKLSPDGMLIRTTKLPKNAKDYEYILECYPNKFYEKKFEFMLTENWKTKRNPDSYAYPVEMKTETFKNWYTDWPLIEEMDKHLYEWSSMAEKYLQYVFNVDYRTVGDKWIESLASLYSKSNVDYSDHMRTYYIGQMKENNVVVESSIIAVEPSTLYKDNGEYCMRAYVRYRIFAIDINVKQSKLIYTQYPALNNLKNGKWREGIFDIRYGTNNGSSGDGSDFTISDTSWFIDDFNVPVE